MRPATTSSCSMTSRTLSSLPSSEQGLPALKPTTTSSGSSGQSAMSAVVFQMSSGGSFQGSSSTPHSMARPQRLSSIEYGFALVRPTGMPWASAKAISCGRVCRSHTRTGAMTCRSGSSAWTLTSKRTWSLPLPVQPCAMYFAPWAWATSTRCFEMSGRDRALSSGYLFSYRPLAAMALQHMSSANSSRTSRTMDSIAPQSSAFLRENSRSSASCPTFTSRVMTSRSLSWMSHWMHTEVSRPPEYASTTLSRAMLELLSSNPAAHRGGAFVVRPRGRTGGS